MLCLHNMQIERSFSYGFGISIGSSVSVETAANELVPEVDLLTERIVFLAILTTEPGECKKGKNNCVCFDYEQV